MSRVAAVVLSYRPDLGLLENVQAIADQVDHVVIVDNQTTHESRKILSQLEGERVSMILNDQNLGVATGFNQGIHWALGQNFDYILLMDQDSRPKEQMVSKLKVLVGEHERNGRLILAGPRHEDFRRRLFGDHLAEVEEHPLLITSGSLLSRKLIARVGYYDDRLFIDHVDHDYCLRVIKSGGKCIRLNTAVLRHKFGEARVRSFVGKEFFLQDYSPFRRYHMMRNRIVLYKRYGVASGRWFWMDLRIAAKDLVKVVFFESNKFSKLKATARGLWDGLIWKDS